LFGKWRRAVFGLPVAISTRPRFVVFLGFSVQSIRYLFELSLFAFVLMYKGVAVCKKRMF